jgi:hypothetical protein
MMVWPAIGCTASSSSSPPLPVARADETPAYEAELTYCVDEVNRLRSTVGKPPLARSISLDRYAAIAVRRDALSGTPHAYALSTELGHGTARAENEALLGNLAYFKTVKTVVERSLARMWDEGPGGVHYDNMVGDYTAVGCGIFVQGDLVATLQAFK